MSFMAQCGTLTVPGSTGNQQVGGLDFAPVAVLFFGSDQSAAGTQPNAVCMIGAATSSGNRHASSSWSEDGTATSTTAAGTSAARVIRFQDTTGAVSPSADFVSLNSDGFTVNWTVVESGKIVHWLALGGDVSVWVGSILSGTSTGNLAYTGVGFPPDALLLLKPHGQGTTTTAGGGVTVAPSFGFAASPTARACMALIDRDGQAAADSARYQRADRCYAVLSDTASLLLEADLESFDADGFTLDWTTAHGTARTILAVAIAGVQAHVGSWNQRSGAGSQAVTGVGFPPLCLLAMGWGAVANPGVVTADMDGYLGWATGPSEEGCLWVGSNDAADPSECDSGTSTTRCVQSRTPGTAALVAEAELTSFDADGMTLEYTTADAVARQNLFLALGAIGGGGGAGPWIEHGTVAPGVQQALIGGLTNGVEYEVRVKTRDASGNTSAGTTPVAGTPAQAVLLPPPLRGQPGRAASAPRVAARGRGR